MAKRLTSAEKFYVAEIIDKVVKNLENSETTDSDSDNIGTDDSLLIVIPKEYLSILQRANKKLNP